ncbi:myosin-9-like [Chenopodium quinoa]|uniref:myosin-9-like n=1 Tax=Chenopodium quinoa TaxID=63459 RepID=UPI000B797E93|nr:myosin-9-like [Chenopodium quinoa]
MDENLGDKESLNARIQQLEHEKDELQKDIEQLCMQQAGPSYITFATQMYCRRTAGLEQEVENLKKKLTNSIKENSNIKEELSEAQRIKTYIDQLHKSEVAKNSELAKQLEYMRGMLTNAFTDRDHAILEAEKAKENEDMMSQKMNDAEKRLQEVTVKFADTQEQLSSMKRKVAKQDQEMEIFREIINKFYKIRQQACRGNGDDDNGCDDQCDDVCWDDKCACLYNDSSESWSFNIYKEASVANYVAALQEEVETLRSDLQNKMQMGWEIEKHLKSKITELEHKRILSDRLIVEGISSIREYNSQQKTYIMKLLDDEKSYIKSVVSSIQEKIEEFPKHTHSAEVTDFSTLNVSRMVDSSEALSQALQEKVSTLLLLSQQEERHLFEKNVQGALQETMDELQRTLQLATQEKVRALLELAEVKKEYQLLLEKTTEEGNLLTRPGDGKIIAHGRDGRLKNLFKRTSLKRWLGTEENPPVVTHPNLEPEASLNRGSYHNMNDARLRIEIATLKESMQNLERLTFDIRKLRVSLIQAKHARSSKSAASSTTEILDEIIREAEMVKLALSAALPLSWSGEGDVASSSDMNVDEDSNYGNPNTEKMDSVSAAGIEMVELLILAAQMMKKREKKVRREHKLQ